jgi:hypothetical protein
MKNVIEDSTDNNKSNISNIENKKVEMYSGKKLIQK